MTKCENETYINLSHQNDEVYIWTASCNSAPPSAACGFTFVYTDEGGDKPNPDWPLMITSGEMQTWHELHGHWSSLSETARQQFEADHSMRRVAR